MRSDKLIHFPSQDPLPVSIPLNKLQASAEIAAQIAAFHAGGGEIQTVGSESNRNPEFLIGNTIRPRK